jgi:hypothetical protein
MTRSLLSGCDAPLSMMSGSLGGSCMPSFCSRPYALGSAADAASAAIDFSKGNVEEGVVDSPPSWGPTRTPICSPSPMKRTGVTPSQLRSQSPTLRTPNTPHRKLYADDAGDIENRRLEDRFPLQAPPSDSPLPGEEMCTMFERSFRGRRQQVSAGIPSEIPRRVETGGPVHSKCMGGGSTPSNVPITRQTAIQHFLRSNYTRSTATADPYINTVNRSFPRPSPRSSRSLSPDGISESKRKRRRELMKLIQMGTGCPTRPQRQ